MCSTAPIEPFALYPVQPADVTKPQPLTLTPVTPAPRIRCGLHQSEQASQTLRPAADD
jgi:hypothetical protein